MHPGPQPIVVAGATGFIGTALASHLGGTHRLIGLTRSNRRRIDNYEETRQVDLFSRNATVAALSGAKVAVYLVHSMMPTARLVQAHFSDLDLLCAENFAEAAAVNGIEHIIYVGGLQPSGAHTSKHLKSRQEVEEALGSYGVPVTTLRAGLVIGGRGSSFQILKRLVSRLPIMVCPSWTNTLTSPVAIGDVVWAIAEAASWTSPKTATYDLGIDTPITYKDLMAATAQEMGLKRAFLPVPLVTPSLSRLWVSAVTGAPKPLVHPLIQSLRYEMIARNDPHFRIPGDPQTPLKTMLPEALKTADTHPDAPRAFRPAIRTQSPPRVLSIQRGRLKHGQTASWAAEQYLRWLPQGMKGLNPIGIGFEGESTHFRLGKRGPVLLSFIRDRDADYESFRVTGGWLAKRNQQGRLEFRTALNSSLILTGVHEFEPRLPWWIYRFTQALFHTWVMHRFLRFIEKQPTTPRGFSLDKGRTAYGKEHSNNGPDHALKFSGNSSHTLTDRLPAHGTRSFS
jgi:uncharacterized protein YbjT (DUF2867 family)